MKHVLFTILAALFAITAMAQNDGSACENAIYVDSTLVKPVKANTTYWFTAYTEDLPLTVYFYPDEESDSDPVVYVDFTCEPGVYDDENIRDIVDLAGELGVYFPLSLPFDSIQKDGRKVYRVSYDRSLLELMAELGVDYSVPVYVAFISDVAGTMQMDNIKTVTNCEELCLRVEMQDTLYLQANKEMLYYFPVDEWEGNNLSFTWTGNAGVRAYLETDCDFDTLTSRYTYTFEDTNSSGKLMQVVSETDVLNYIRSTEDGNLYAMFMAPEDGTIYVGDYVDHGSVTINTCIGNRKSTAIDFPTAEAGLAMAASIPSKSYRFEASTIQNQNIRLKWKTTENKLAVAYFANFCGFNCNMDDPDVIDSVHFVYNEAEQAMIAEIPMERVNKLVKQNTDGWLFMQIYRQEAGTFWWDIYEIVHPDCDSKSILLEPNDSVYMPANYYDTSYKLKVDSWKGYDHTFTWHGKRQAYVFIADTCSFPLTAFNEHVGKYMEINPNETVTLPASEMENLVSYYSDDFGNVYLRLRSVAEGSLVTHQVREVVTDTVITTVAACESYTWHGKTYTESGTYEYKSQTEAWVIHLEILQLTINHSTTVEQTETACGSYTWHGQVYTESGTYQQLLETATGCDSLVLLHLTVNHGDTLKMTAATCNSYTWNDVTYTQSGIYEHKIPNNNGCYDVQLLDLTINYSDTVEIAQTACDSYTWYGKSYTQSGTYIYRIKNSTGCDSLEILHLTINYGDTVEISEVACESYTWHGQKYTEEGTYTFLSQTEQGCDSLEILHLTFDCDDTALTNPTTAQGRNTRLVKIDNQLYVQITDGNTIEYYDMLGRKAEINK